MTKIEGPQPREENAKKIHVQALEEIFQELVAAFKLANLEAAQAPRAQENGVHTLEFILSNVLKAVDQLELPPLQKIELVACVVERAVSQPASPENFQELRPISLAELQHTLFIREGRFVQIANLLVREGLVSDAPDGKKYLKPDVAQCMASCPTFKEFEQQLSAYSGLGNVTYQKLRNALLEVIEAGEKPINQNVITRTQLENKLKQIMSGSSFKKLQRNLNESGFFVIPAGQNEAVIDSWYLFAIETFVTYDQFKNFVGSAFVVSGKVDLSETTYSQLRRAVLAVLESQSQS